MEDPTETFRGIYSRFASTRLSHRELSKLPAVRKLLETKDENKPSRTPFGVFSVALLVLSVAVYHDALGEKPLTKMWFHIFGRDVHSEMCTVYMPTDLWTLFLPPFDCSTCKNLTSVERVTEISPAMFESRYAYSSVPVVVADGTKNWTALEIFSFDFFKDLYLGDVTRKFESECQFFPYATEFNGLAQVLNMSVERAAQPWYIGWSNCDRKVGTVLRKHYHRPYFLPLQSESTNMDWIFMGKPGYGADMHIDHVSNPSWQAQIRGRKQWTLQPLPECARECRTLDVTVEAGEVIVVDTNKWYHKTLAIGDEISITIGSEYD